MTVETRDLTKYYWMGKEKVVALDGVDMKMEESEFISVVGPSGSGKSTLLNVIGCLDAPTKGEVYLAGWRTDSKLRAIEKEGHALFVAPYVKDMYVTQNKTAFWLKGITPEYRQIHRNLQLERGSWFDEGKKSIELVLGYDVAKRLAVIESLGIGDEFVAEIRLYGEDSRPIDKTRDKTAVFKIVGILKSTGGEHDDEAMVEIATARALDEKDAYDGAFVN